MTVEQAHEEIEAMNRQIAWSSGDGRYVARPETVERLRERRDAAVELLAATLR